MNTITSNLALTVPVLALIACVATKAAKCSQPYDKHALGTHDTWRIAYDANDHSKQKEKRMITGKGLALILSFMIISLYPTEEDLAQANGCQEYPGPNQLII